MVAVTAFMLAAAAAGIGAGVVADDGGAPPRDRVPVLARASARPGLGVPAVPVRGRLMPRPEAAGRYRTMRDVVRTSAGGWDPRVRLTNVFGAGPVTFDDVEVTVPAGAEALSDPVPGHPAAQQDSHLAVANEGLASNRVTANGPGPVILLEGINDIGNGVVTSAGQLIAADTQLIAQAHAAGLRIAPACDSGDHIHPGDAGYQAMADAAGLTLLR